MSRQLTAPTPSVRRLTIVAPLNKGGTASDNTVDAATQLGAINASLVGAAGGPAKVQAGGTLDVNNLPASFPKGATLDGPTDFYIGATHTLTITNYDVASDASYTVSASAGTISRSGATITYVAPSTIQTVTLTIGGRQVQVNVKNTAPITPSIVTPANFSTNQNGTIFATASAYALPTGTPSHQFSDWELAADSSFTNVLQSTFNDSVNKTTWTLLGLTVSTTYWLRVRYKDTNQGYSAWSNPVQFTTKASFSVGAEEAKLVASDKAASDLMGVKQTQYDGPCAISGDGSRVAVGCPNKTYDPSSTNAVQTGAVYIFVRNTSNNTWSQEVKISTGALGQTGATVLSVATVDSSDFFGCAMAFSIDGSRLIVGSYGDEASVANNTGSAYVFSRTGTTWTQEAQLTASDKASGDQFGWEVSLSNDGTRALVSAWQADIGGVLNVGACYVYLRTGTSWAQEAKLQAADRSADNGFGSSCCLNGDATRAVIGAYNNDEASLSNTGSAYIFVRVGTTWGQEQKLIATTSRNAGLMGMSVFMDQNGVRCVIGQPCIGASVPGHALVWVRDTTTNVWTQEADLVASDTANNDNFGISVSINAAGTLIAIGASLVTSTLSQAGGVYTFSRSGSTWTQTAKLTASDKAASDRFGYTVVMSADGGRLASCAPQADPSGVSNAGAAYVYA